MESIMAVVSEKKNIGKPAEISAVLLFLTTIIVIIYFPVFGSFNDYVTSGEPDGFAYWAWRTWMASGLIDSLVEKGNPVHLLFYGVLINNTLPESGNILDVIFISYPLGKILSFPAGYNLKILLILLFNGFAGYFVISRLVRNPWIAVVCAVFIMLNPIVFFAIYKARLRDAVIGFIILSIWYLYRAVSALSVRNAALAGIFLGITSVVYWFYGMFCIWVSIGVFITVFIQIKQRKNHRLSTRFLKRSALAILIMTLIILPFAIWYTPLYQRVNLLSDVTLFKSFPELNTVFEEPDVFKETGDLQHNISRLILMDSAYAGFFPFFIPFVLLGALAFFPFKRFHLWFPLILIFFWLYSLGPYLRTSANITPESFMMLKGEAVKLPYYYMFRFVPVSGRLHHPVEGLVMVSISFMFLSGIGMSVIWKLFRKYRLIRGMLLSCLLLAVILHVWSLQEVKGVPVHPEINILSIPSLYKDMGNKKREGIIELPLNQSADLRCFYKTYHRQKMLLFSSWNMVFLPYEILPDNQFTWSNQDEFDLRDLPFVKSLERFQRGETDRLDMEGLEELKDRGYRYIFLHERDFVEVEEEGNKMKIRGEEDYERFNTELKKRFGKPEIHREFYHCLLSAPMLSKKNNNPHYSFKIAVFEIFGRD